jgi:coenzyme F420-0:L-glutamate ligase / coenzyme F420-1:gamma-L-glutamate ligase
VITARALDGIPEIEPGDDLGALLRGRVEDGEVVVVAQKVVSKAEGRVVRLDEVAAGDEARRLAAEHGKSDPRQVQVVLDESAELMRAERGVLICRTHHGFVCANAGVDASNTEPGTLVLLPRDPDTSARRIRAALGVKAAVVVADSFGRAWRHGQADVAIGVAGLMPLNDLRGETDAGGRPLTATWIAVADEAAAAADLARDKASREPVVVVAGLERFVTEEDGAGAAALVRPPEEDLFR